MAAPANDSIPECVELLCPSERAASYRLPWQPVASRLATRQRGRRAGSDCSRDGVLKLTDTAISPRIGKQITPARRGIPPASSNVVLQVCNVFLDCYRKINPRFCLPALGNARNSLFGVWRNGGLSITFKV